MSSVLCSNWIRLEDPFPIALAGTAPDLTTVVTFRSNSTQEFVVYSGDDLETVKRKCEHGEPLRGRYPRPTKVGAVKSTFAFKILAGNYFSSEDGPIRVFWLSQYFAWFDGRSGDIMQSQNCNDQNGSYPCVKRVPNSAFLEIQAISETDFTVFLIVFGDHKHGILERPSRGELSEAKYMAHYLGGYTTPVTGAIDDTLVHAFEATQRGALLSLEGPVTGGIPKTLLVRVASSSKLMTWQRPFIVDREGHNERILGLHVTPWSFRRS